MAKIPNGILGTLTGKVGGVVGGQWKDVNYIRSYVKPGNPNTVAQQVQRTKMSDTVEFARPLVGAVFNRFLDPFLKSLSGYNRFVQLNIAKFDGDPDYNSIVVTEGKLSPLPSFAVEDAGNPAVVSVTWNASLLPTESQMDLTHFVVYNQTKGIWTLLLDTGTQVAMSGAQLDVDHAESDVLTVYAWYSNVYNNVLQNVASSVAGTHVA